MRSIHALVLCGLAAASACSQPEESPPETATQPSTTSAVASARITERGATARLLELVDGDGRVAAAYDAGFFNASLIVPDPDTGLESPRGVQGTWFLGAAFHAASGRAAVAVRGFVFAETSFDLVYLIETRSSPFAADPYAAGAFTYVPFDGRRNDGVLPPAATPTRPWLDVTDGGVAFDEAGRLEVAISDAAGSQAELTYAPDLAVDTCTWRFAFAPARCPDPTR